MNCSSTKRRLLFIYNPKSGKGRIKYHLADLVEIFAKKKYEITVHPTDYSGEAIQVVEDAQGYDLIVCSGGDGTLNEVVSGNMRREYPLPISYIPTGSTNDFATSIKIPKNMTKAGGVAVDGKSFLCDVGGFDEDYFVYIAAFGIFTEVSYETDQQMKNIIGHLAYVLEAALRLPQTKSYQMTIISDGKRIEGDFLFGMVTNSKYIGGMPNLTSKSTEMDDGLFEVTLIRKPKNPIEVNRIMSSLLIEDSNRDMVYSFKTSKIEFKSEVEVPWTIDGEFGGRKKTVCIRNFQQSLEIMVPNRLKKQDK